MIKDIIFRLLAPGGLLVVLVVYLQNKALLNSFFWEVWLSNIFLKTVLVIFLASFPILTALLSIYLLIPMIKADKDKKHYQRYGFGILWKNEPASMNTDIYDPNYYWHNNNEPAPYCPKCYKVHRFFRRLDLGGRKNFSTELFCPECKKHYPLVDNGKLITFNEAAERMSYRFRPA